MASATFAEDSSLHWYRVTIVAGNTTATFTGSSRLSAGDLEARIESDQIILIENQRDVVERPGETEMHMQPVAEGEKLFISGRAVLYFSELPKDPAVPAKQTQRSVDPNSAKH